MKKRAAILGLCILLVVLLSSCSLLDFFETKYTVWTESSQYVEGQSLALESGTHVKMPLTEYEFSGFNTGSTGKHEWTEDQIYSWFIGRGFDSHTANEATSWLITNDHGVIVTRTSGMIYLILK